MRILRAITRLNVGGPAIQALTMTRAFDDGVNFQTLLVTGLVGKNEGDMDYLAKELGVVYEVMPSLVRRVSPLRDLQSIIILLWKIFWFRPNVIHTHTAKAGMIGRAAGILYNLGRKRKAVLIHTFHGNVFRGYFGKWKTYLFISIERLLARWTDVIVAVSEGQANELIYIYKIAGEDKVTVIPLGFDLARFSELPAPKFEAPLTVAFIGRLTAVKRPEIFLNSAITLLTQIPCAWQFRFLFVGDGELRGDLEAHAASAGIKGQLSFLGWIKDVAPVMRGVDIVVLTSINEGTPVALIEAMAAGRLVITTNVGGVPDLLGKVIERRAYYNIAERGLLLNSVNAAEGCLTMALTDVALNSREFLPLMKRAREFAVNFSSFALKESLANVYKERGVE